jgi:hypothetical protein
MYDNLVFADRKEAFKTTEMNDAIRYADSFTVTPTKLKVGDLIIRENGTIQNDVPHLVTRFGFENLCSILGIPNPFARMIPPDLLFTNIERLQKENADKKIVLLERPDGSIANVVKSPYKELPYSTVLAPFIEKEGIKNIDIGETLMKVTLTFDETKFNGIGVDDTMFIGTFLYASILKVRPLHVQSGFYRTHCENSFIAPYLGKITADYKLEGEERVLRFAEVLRCWDDDVFNRVKSNYSVFEHRFLFAHEFANFWRKVNRVLGQSETDLLFHTHEEARKDTISHATQWLSENKRARLLGEAIDEPIITTFGAYDVVNAITKKAQDFHEVDRYELEKIGGELIGKILLN